MTEDLIIVLKDLKKYCSSEKFDISKFTLMIEKYEKQYNIKSNEILELLYNKDTLVTKVSLITEDIDKEIKKLEEQISNLEYQKYKYGSLICELHGHNLDRTENDSWFCSNCGKFEFLRGNEVNKYLRKQEKAKSKIYKYKEND